MPDQGDPGRRRGTVRSTANGMWPNTRHGAPDEEPADTPLYRTEPDRGLRYRTVLLVGLVLIAALAGVCVAGILLGSVALVVAGAVGILATVVLVVVFRR